MTHQRSEVIIYFAERDIPVRGGEPDNMEPRQLPDCQSAMPSLIFSEIFSHLSPGFLWVVGRRVCKSWKTNIETGSALYEGIRKTGVLYFYIHKTRHWKNRSQESIDFLQTYQCTGYNIDRGTVKFTSTNNEPLTLKNETVYYSFESQECLYNDIRVGTIHNSIFPQNILSKRTKLSAVEKSKLQLKRGKIRVYNNPIGQVKKYYVANMEQFTPEEANSFPSKPKVRQSEEEISEQYHDTGKFLCDLYFDRPIVDLEIQYGIYIFKCIFKTRLSPTTKTTPELVEEIEISVTNLLKWRYSCQSRGKTNPCDLETLTSWTCPSLPFPSRKNKTARNLFPELLRVGPLPKVLQRYDPPFFQDLFPSWIENERNKNRIYNATTLPCAQCQRWLPSKRCVDKLCRQCCRSRVQGHRGISESHLSHLSYFGQFERIEQIAGN